MDAAHVNRLKHLTDKGEHRSEAEEVEFKALKEHEAQTSGKSQKAAPAKSEAAKEGESDEKPAANKSVADKAKK